jgi:molybdopterin converting factor small subunit
MQVHVTLYGALRVVAGKQFIDLEFDTPTITMQQLFDALVTAHPIIHAYLLDSNLHTLHPNTRVQLNSQRVPRDRIMRQVLHDNDRISLLSPHAGAKVRQ